MNRCTGILLPVYNFEFTLERRFRRHLVIRGIAAFVIGVIFAVAAQNTWTGLPKVGVIACAVVTLAYTTLWLVRGRFVTRISLEGVEVRRYLLAKRIPWSEVRDIQTYDFQRTNAKGVAGSHISGISHNSSSAKKAVCVKVIRTSGRKIELPAPLVTRSQADPDFAEKVRTIKAVRDAVRTGTGYPAQAVQQH